MIIMMLNIFRTDGENQSVDLISVEIKTAESFAYRAVAVPQSQNTLCESLSE